MDSLNIETKKLIKCCLSNDNHIIKSARILACGGNCCLKCIDKCFKDNIACYHCNKTHCLDYLKKSFSNPLVDAIVNYLSDDILKESKEKFRTLLVSFREIFSDEYLKNRFEFIQEDIDIWAESLKINIDSMANNLKQKVKKIRDKFNKLKTDDKIKCLEESTFKSNNFCEVQENLFKLELLRNATFQSLNQITFKQNTIDSIGYLDYPCYFNFNQIKSTKSMFENNYSQIECIKSSGESVFMVNGNIQEISLNKSKINNIYTEPMKSSYLCDVDNFTVFIVDAEKGIFYVYNREIGSLKLRSSYHNECFIGSNYTKAVFISERSFTTSFEYLISSTKKNTFIRLKKVPSRAEPTMTSVQLCRPKQFIVNNKRIFIISDTRYISSDDKLESIIDGENCIYVLDYLSLEIIQKIKLDDWLAPNGLCIDSGNMTYTIAHDLKADNQIGDQSIFIINTDGFCLHKILLNFSQNIRDFTFCGNYLVAVKEDEIVLVNFS